MRTMAVFLPETFPALHLKRNHFVSLHMIDDLCLHCGFHIFSGSELAIEVGQQHIAEINFVTGIALHVGNIQCLVFLNPELLTGYFYNCEHNFKN